MEFFSLIIDRVQTTNVFNIIQGRLPSRDTHLQSIVDDDLIIEFLTELDRWNRVSRSMHDQELNITQELQRIGEVFFLQFFPEKIQERLRQSERGFLFFHVDQKLGHIPWELLHEGTGFLADKYFIGKNISGHWRERHRPEKDKLRVLIIADPTEDLDWARQEGEGLFESLQAEVPSDRIDLHFISGRRITKLSLLNAMKNKDIVHYAGHLHFAVEEQESGWLLSDGKVLRAREIEKAGLSPDLVFSNSCFSSPLSHTGGNNWEDLAGAFLRAGICNYIGTNWEIRDNKNTLDFALQFYRSIFDERTVGEALFESRQYARRSYPVSDITWANYVLHGNPRTRIFRSTTRRSFDASRNILNARKVMESYPEPIASTYAKFFELSEKGMAYESLLELFCSFENCLKITGALVFGHYRFFGMKGTLPSIEKAVDIKTWVNDTYECLSHIRSLKKEVAAPGLLEAFLLHKDSIHKLIAWNFELESGQIGKENCESYLVTSQYLYDNLLTDLSSLGRFNFLYICDDMKEAYLLSGSMINKIKILPSEFRDLSMLDQVKKYKKTVCFYNSSRKIFFSLDGFMSYDPGTMKISFPPLLQKKDAGV